MAVSAARITRLGNYGGPRAKYASFAGKTAVAPAAPPKHEGLRRNVGKLMR